MNVKVGQFRSSRLRKREKGIEVKRLRDCDTSPNIPTEVQIIACFLENLDLF